MRWEWSSSRRLKPCLLYTSEDPRRELVERLLEHERFKNAAQMLLQKQQIEAATWSNPAIRVFRTEEAVSYTHLQQTNAQALLAFWDPQILWVAANQDSLPPGCKLLMSSKDALGAVQSKHDQLQVAQRCGFSVLPTWELSRHDDVSRIDHAAYPVCLRPSAPQGVKPTFKAEVLQSPSELKAFLAGRTWGPEPLLVQPFLPHPSVVIHGVRSESGELLALEGFIAPLKFEAISLALRPFRIDEKIAQCCRNFVDEVGITGPFHFDLLYSAETGDFYYLCLLYTSRCV